VPKYPTDMGIIWTKNKIYECNQDSEFKVRWYKQLPAVCNNQERIPYKP